MAFTTGHFDQVLSIPHYMSSDSGNPPGVYSTGEEISHRVLQAFENLNKQLRNLSQLPLAVISVVGTSPVFRHTEVPVYPFSFVDSCILCHTQGVSSCSLEWTIPVISYSHSFQ